MAVGKIRRNVVDSVVYVGDFTAAEAIQIDGMENAANWSASSNITLSNEATIKQEGTYSMKVAVDAAFTTGLMAYRSLTAADFRDYYSFSFFVRSTVEIPVGGLSLKIDDTSNAFGSLIFSRANPYVLAADTWYQLQVRFGQYKTDMDMSATRYIGLFLNSDLGAQDIYIDRLQVDGKHQLQVAMDSLSATPATTYDRPGIVFMEPNTTYSLTNDQSPIVVGNDVAVVGQGANSVITIPNNSNKSTAVFEQLGDVDKNDVIFLDFLVDGNKANQSNPGGRISGFDLRGITNLYFGKVQVTNCELDSVYLNNLGGGSSNVGHCQNVTLEDCIMTNAGRNEVSAICGYNIKLAKNWFAGSGLHNVDFEPNGTSQVLKWMTLEQNYLLSSASHGLVAFNNWAGSDTCVYFTAEDNFILQPTGHGFYCYDFDVVNFLGNTVWDPGNCGAQIQNGVKLRAADNFIIDPYNHGLYIVSNSQADISHNRVDSSDTGHGIYIYQIDYTECNNNTVVSNALHGIFYDGGNGNVGGTINSNIAVNNGQNAGAVRAGIALVSSSGYEMGYFAVNGNICYDSANTQDYGIFVDYLRNSEIIGNVCYGNQLYGIYTDHGLGLDVSHNNCQYNAVYGICINSNMSNSQYAHNVVRNNSSGQIYDVTGSSSGVVIKDNPGFNPVGASSITPGASPYTYTAGNSPEYVYIYGGTVSNISRGGRTIATGTNANIPVVVALEPEQTLIVTYSAVPTMEKDIK